MSLAEHQGWIFSEGNPPKVHTGGLYPICGRSYINPWVYLIDTRQWYFFDASSKLWFVIPGNGIDAMIPKEYQVQLLLLT